MSKCIKCHGQLELLDPPALKAWRAVDVFGPEAIKRASEAIETLSKYPADQVREAIARVKSKRNRTE
jgi:hypothetical protein